MNKNPKKYIDSKLGLIKEFNQENISQIQKESVCLAGVTIEPNSKTTLNDFFNDEVVYLGLHDDYMQFQIGNTKDLFGDQIYTSEFKKLSDTSIMTIYQRGTARDYNFKNGIWK